MITSTDFTSPWPRPRFRHPAALAGLAGLFLLLLLSLVARAQAPDIVWQNALGGSFEDDANAITLSGDGGFVVAGTTESNDGDVSGNRGGFDFWVTKLDASGNLVWQKSLGGSGDDYATAITLSGDGGFVVAGTTESNDGDVSGNRGGFDFWVTKLDASGNLVWQKALGGSGSDQARAITPSGDGGFVVAGLTTSNDGDVSGNRGGGDFWVIKLDASGNLVWQKALGGSNGDFGRAITSSGSGNFVVTGTTNSNDGDASASTDVDGSGHRRSGDFWVVKLGDATPPTPNTGIRYVNASRPDDNGDGLSWATAHKHLQTALAAVASGEQIWVASGTYKPTTSTTNRAASFVMKENVKIYGGFTSGQANVTDRNPDPATNGTVLSGDIDNNGALPGNSYHVIDNDGNGLTAAAVLDGFKITGGNADGPSNANSKLRNGGGMYLGNASPTIENCLFQSNFANSFGGAVFILGAPSFIRCSFVQNRANLGGGAVELRGGSAGTKFDNCVFRSNTAGSGGALRGFSTASFTDCSFESNSVDNSRFTMGGAVFSNGGDLQFLRCSFAGNSAPAGTGGAIHNQIFNTRLGVPGARTSAEGGLSLTNCTFLNNTAFQGGVLYNSFTSLKLTNCSFIGNSASDDGGVLYEYGGNTRFVNGSFQGNSAAVSGGAVYITQNAAVAITNSVLWNNGGANTIGTGGSGTPPGTVTLAYTLIDQQDVPAGTGNKVTSTNPFVSMTSNVLREGSPAIDMGLNSANDTDTDLAGNARVFNGTIDMGAYESQTTVTPPADPPTVSNLTASPGTVCAGQPVTFTATVGNTSGNYDYTLTNNNGATKSGTASGGSFSQSVTASGSGSQTFTLTVTNANGSGMGSTSLTVNALPTATLTNDGPLTSAKTSVTLTAGGGSSYSFGGGASQQGTGNTATVSAPGTYTVTVTNAAGCTATASTTVVQDGTPPPPTTGECLALGDQCSGNRFEVKNYNFNMAAAGFRTLALTYRSAESPATLRLTVNGTLRTMMLSRTPADGSFATVTLGGTYPFSAGNNTISIASGDGYFCFRQLCTDGGNGTPPPPPPPAPGNCLALGDQCSGNQFEVKNYTLGQATAGNRTLALTYRSAEGPATLRLTVNGALRTMTLPQTPANGAYATVTLGGTFALNAGNNSIGIASGGGYFCFRQLCTDGDGTPPPPPPAADDCLALGDQCSGNQFEVKNYTLAQATAGNRTLALTYRSAESPATLRLTVNGALRTMALPQTPANGAYATVTLGGTFALNAGNNSIGIASGGGYFCFRQLCTQGGGASARFGLEEGTVVEIEPLVAYPNPTEGTFGARFYLTPGQRATLDVSDALGRQVWRKALTGQGPHDEQVRLPEAAGGMYFLRLQREGAGMDPAAEFVKVLVVK